VVTAADILALQVDEVAGTDVAHLVLEEAVGLQRRDKGRDEVQRACDGVLVDGRRREGGARGRGRRGGRGTG